MEFPQRLAKIRKDKKLSFPEPAKMLDIHPSQLRRYEKASRSRRLRY